MGPKAAVMRGVRITISISVLMVHAMRGDPEYGAAFQRQSAACRQKVFDPSGSLVPTVRKQAMVTHPDPETAGNPPHHHREYEGLPTEEEQRRECPDMKSHHERCC
jgi:hypothetical protein